MVRDVLQIKQIMATSWMYKVTEIWHFRKKIKFQIYFKDLALILKLEKIRGLMKYRQIPNFNKMFHYLRSNNVKNYFQ